MIMETRIATRDEFLKRYWNYYLLLEKDFLSIEQYLAIDELNFSAFSNEYIKQYQTICSEIDVIAKSFCKKIDARFSGSSINAYCKCITDNHIDFSSRVVKLEGRDIKVIPWKDWAYSIEPQSNGNSKIVATNPDWWQKYNKIKHNRTTINNDTNLPYYKLANQKNVLNALAALFQLEMYYYRLLHQIDFSNQPDMPYPLSQIFVIENWGNHCQMISDIMFIDHSE